MSKKYTSTVNALSFPYSSNIGDIIKDGDKLSFKVNYPAENMQTDAANFEAIALMCRCAEPGCKVEIDFTLCDWNGRFGNNNFETSTYLRFLYRADVFRRAFDWVDFSVEAKAEIDRFVNSMGAVHSNNIPDNFATYNENKGSEHVIEYKLTHSQQGKQHLIDLVNAKTGKNLVAETINNQLPNGLFSIAADGKPEERNRIFTTGYYDIWALDDDECVCVFELKKEKGNEKLGIISELFFYATYAQDILINPEHLHNPKPQKNHRGYERLYDAVHENKLKGVNAYFLVAKGGVHKSIEDAKTALLEELNRNSFHISFDFLYYDPQLIEKIEVD